MAEEKNENKAASSISRNKLIVGMLAVLTSAGIGGYHYFQTEEPPPPIEKKTIKEAEPVQGIGFIDIAIIKDALDKDGQLAELTSLETRLKLELKDLLKPMLMNPPKIEQKPFDDSVWQKNAQVIISEAAEIEKRKRQAEADYRKETEAEYFKKRDEVNDRFLNEVINIKLKLQNADNMRLSSAQVNELKKQLVELQEQRNQAQRQLLNARNQDVETFANEAVKADKESLRVQFEEAKTKITEEAKQTQSAALERNKDDRTSGSI